MASVEDSSSMMHALAVGGVAFIVVFGGAWLGVLLRPRLPEHHVTADSKDIVKLGIGLLATMAALVLGLLIASAKGSYDTQRGELTQLATDIILLDRVLADYGPETRGARDLLRRAVARALERLSTSGASRPVELELSGTGAEPFYKLQALS